MKVRVRVYLHGGFYILSRMQHINNTSCWINESTKEANEMKGKLNDHFTQVAATIFVAGATLMGLGAIEPDDMHEGYANELISSICQPLDDGRCSTRGNLTNHFRPSNGILREI
jgi:hypothetical protein